MTVAVDNNLLRFLNKWKKGCQIHLVRAVERWGANLMWSLQSEFQLQKEVHEFCMCLKASFYCSPPNLKVSSRLITCYQEHRGHITRTREDPGGQCRGNLIVFNDAVCENAFISRYICPVLKDQ